jgi:uroporphyrinogen decarboxylase
MAAPPADANDRFLRACRLQPVDRTPVWFMRQAGRYLPEYGATRGDHDVLEAARTPDLAVELTLQPIRRMPVDAAVLFSDIMVPLAAIGIGVRIEPGLGPVVDEPLRTATDLRRLRPLEPESDESFVLEAIRLLRKELKVPLIAFAGAPFTVASYLIEGGPSRDHALTKSMMRADPRLWGMLADALADLAVAHLRAQVEAGAQAVQVFDSWVGALDAEDYERFVLPPTRRLFAGIAYLDVPSIHFGVGTGELLSKMQEAGGDLIGVDWRVPLDVAWDRIGPGTGIQGNLDPTACLAPWDELRPKALAVLERTGGRPGHVFNLGHGVLPATPVENLQRVVELVHETTGREEL